MQVKEFKMALPFLVRRNVATLVQGAHGTGKSQVMAQMAKALGFTKFVDLRFGTCADAGDLLGLQEEYKDADGETRFRFTKPEWWPKEGEKTFILLDEINQATKIVQPFIFQLALDYHIGPHKLDKATTYVAAAMNPDTDDYSGNSSLDNKALLSRFCQLKWTPTYEEFLSYGREFEGFSSDFIGFLKENEMMLENTGLQSFQIHAKPDRRALTRAHQLISDGLPENLWVEVLGGMLGMEVSSKLQQYFRDNETKPLTGEEVLNEYTMKTKKTRQRLLSYLEKERHDVIAITLDNVVAMIKKEVLTKKQGRNLAAFLIDVPKDMGRGMMESIVQDFENLEHVQKNSTVFVDEVLTDEVLSHYAELEKAIAEREAKEAADVESTG